MSFRLRLSADMTICLLLILLLAPSHLYAADLQEAYSLYNQAEFEAAAQIFESLRDRGELRASDLALLGMCYLNLNKFQDAKQAISLAARLDPGGYLVLLSQGNMFLLQEEYGRAEEFFKKAHRTYPRRPEASQGLAAAILGQSLSLIRRGAFEAAAEEASRALQLQPKDPQLLSTRIAALRRTSRSRELEQAYRRYLELRPSSAEANAGLGILLHEQDRTAESLPFLRKAVELDSIDPEPFLILGREVVSSAQLQTGSQADSQNDGAALREARTLLQEAVGKAVQLYNMYRMQAAKELQQKPSESDTPGGSEDQRGPDKAHESEREAGTDKGLGKVDAASPDENSLQRLKQLSEQAERPKKLLQDSLTALTSLYSDTELMLEDLHRLASWYPSSSEVRSVLAEELLKAGALAQARQEWQSLTEDFPFYYAAHIGLSRCLEQEGKLVQAALSARRALDLAPDEPDVYRRLQEVYLEMEKPEVYLQVLEMQILKDKYNPLLYNKAAEAALAIGKTETAELYRKRAEKLQTARQK